MSGQEIRFNGTHWVITNGGIPLARSTKREVLEKHWPEATVKE